MHGYIHQKGKTLPVAISTVTIPMKTRVSRRFAIARRPWPVFHLCWIQTGMEMNEFRGFFFLGGLKLDQLVAAENALELFWDRYKVVDANSPRNPRRTIPFFIHGDEGRGQVKRPLLIISFQCLMSWTGTEKVNSTKSFGSKG